MAASNFAPSVSTSDPPVTTGSPEPSRGVPAPGDGSSGGTSGGLAKAVHIPPERLARWLDNFATRHGETTYDVEPTVVTVHAADGATARIDVPFGPLEELSREGLIAHVLTDRRLGILLVRRGGYGAGVFHGLKLIESKVGSRHVQGKTKAGGWSQQRFARRREGQARVAFEAAAEAAVRILLPHARELDALICGGDRTAVDGVLLDPRLKAFPPLVQGPFLAVPDPRQKVLEQAGLEARAIRIDLTEPA